MRLRFYNTLTRSKNDFIPIKAGHAGLYTCGPTVYHYAHVGNLRTYIFEDILKRTLKKAGYTVNHVMNITDVGHLTSDADEGEDKMIKAMLREKKSVWDIAKFYEKEFLNDYDRLGIQRPNVICRATEHIPEMINHVEGLVNKGIAYVVDGNVYFDITKFPAYADFGKLDLKQQQEGARVDTDGRKRNQADFVLWFSKSKSPNQVMKWESPWGVGFPGWHIECSAMASKFLGNQFDIHCGGIDHIPVHHTNEIAQSEAFYGHRWVNYWMHGEFLAVDSSKMSKSSGDFLTLGKLIEAGFDPVHYRFFCLNAHYRSSLNFSFQALEDSKKAFENLKNRVIEWRKEVATPSSSAPDVLSQSSLDLSAKYKERFWNQVADDLSLHLAMPILWEVVKDNNLTLQARVELLEDFDDVLGIGVKNFRQLELAAEQKVLVDQRAEARKEKKWQLADDLRRKLEGQGVFLKDYADHTDYYFGTPVKNPNVENAVNKFIFEGFRASIPSAEMPAAKTTEVLVTQEPKDQAAHPEQLSGESLPKPGLG